MPDMKDVRLSCTFIGSQRPQFKGELPCQNVRESSAVSQHYHRRAIHSRKSSSDVTSPDPIRPSSCKVKRSRGVLIKRNMEKVKQAVDRL